MRSVYVYDVSKFKTMKVVVLYGGSSYIQVSTVRSPRQLWHKISMLYSACISGILSRPHKSICSGWLLKKFFWNLTQYLTFITPFLMPCVSVSDVPKCVEVHKHWYSVKSVLMTWFQNHCSAFALNVFVFVIYFINLPDSWIGILEVLLIFH
jgi:hypothetical protein